MLQFKGIRTVKTDKGEKNVKVMGFSTSDKDLLRKVLTENGVVVLGIQENANPIGNLYEVVLLSRDKEPVNIVFPVEGKIREAFDYLIENFGEKIVYSTKFIKPYGKEISEDKLIAIFRKLLEEKGFFNKGKDKHTHKDGGGKIVVDSNLKKELLQNVDEFIKEMEEFLPRVQDQFPLEVSELQKILGELKKYRISTNLYKLSENFKKGLSLSEELYEKYFRYEQQKENRLVTIKILSDLEIVQEYKKYEKVKRAKVLEKVNAKEFGFPWYEILYYKIFGKVGLYFKLLLEGFYKRYKQKKVDISLVYNFFQFLLIFLIIDYALLMVYFKFSGQLNKISVSYLMLIYFGYFGFVLTLSKLFLEKNKLIAFMIILLGFLLFPVFKNFFAIYI